MCFHDEWPNVSWDSLGSFVFVHCLKNKLYLYLPFGDMAECLLLKCCDIPLLSLEQQIRFSEIEPTKLCLGITDRVNQHTFLSWASKTTKIAVLASYLALMISSNRGAVHVSLRGPSSIKNFSSPCCPVMIHSILSSLEVAKLLIVRILFVKVRTV